MDFYIKSVCKTGEEDDNEAVGYPESGQRWIHEGLNGHVIYDNELYIHTHIYIYIHTHMYNES